MNDASRPSPAMRAVRSALAGTPAWLVGGAPRDRALGRDTFDLDVVVDGSPAQAARAIARAARGAGGSGGAACFELSEEFAGWRVVARDRGWQVDVQPLRGGSLAADLRMRDFTVGAIAEPVGGGEPIDPLGGLADIAARRLRMVSPRAFGDDPLRILRLVRLALDLGFEVEPGTERAARAGAAELRGVAGERVFMELRRVVASPRVLDGLGLMDALGATAVVLPELDALRGARHGGDCDRDAYEHTLAVLDRTIALQRDPARVLGDPLLAGPVAALLAEPLADELTRGGALRWGALLSGVETARDVLGRLRASERLRAHVAALVRHRSRLMALSRAPQPLSRRVVFDYLRATAPVEVDVTLLAIADRLAGLTGERDRAPEAIAAHMPLARAMLADALRWREAGGAPAPLWRGDELAGALGVSPGPRLGELLLELSAAQYAGEVLTRAQALDYVRGLLWF